MHTSAREIPLDAVVIALGVHGPFGLVILLCVRTTHCVVEVQHVIGREEISQLVFRLAQVGWRRSRGFDSDQVRNEFLRSLAMAILALYIDLILALGWYKTCGLRECRGCVRAGGARGVFI